MADAESGGDGHISPADIGHAVELSSFRQSLVSLVCVEHTHTGPHGAPWPGTGRLMTHRGVDDVGIKWAMAAIAEAP